MEKKFIIIHHTGVSRSNAKYQFYAVNKYHKDKWGMKSVYGYYHGYTHYLGTNGVITQTRAIREEGAHTIGYNKSDHIAICLAGDFSLEYPTKDQVTSLTKFIKEYPHREFKLHNELNMGRICPGFNLNRGAINRMLNTQEDLNKEREIQEKINLITILLERLKNLLKLFKI